MAQLKYWDGSQWATAVIGSKGAQGVQGVQGVQGIIGPTGVVAATAPVTYTSGTQTVALNIGSSLTTSASNLIVDSTVVPYLANANTFTLGPNTFQTGAAGNIGLIVKAAASQTANLIQGQDSTGVSWFAVSTFGNTRIGSSSDLGGRLSVSSGNSSTVAAVIRGVASQTANLTEWQNSSGTILANISSAGDYVTVNSLLRATTGSVYGSLQLQNGGSNETIFYPYTAGLLIVNGGVAGMVVTRIRGVSNQTADLTQWQSGSTIIGGANALAQIYTGSTAPITSGVGGAVTGASGTGTTATVTLTSAPNLAVGDLITVAGINPSGYNATNVVVTAVSNTAPFSVSYANATTAAWVSGGTVSAPAQASVTARSQGTIGLILKAAASSGADLQQWQSNTGTIVSKVLATGAIVTNTRMTVGSTNYLTNAILNVVSQATTTIGLMVQGVASQTADLQQWQNSSATVLAKIDASGNIFAPTLQSTTASTATLTTNGDTGGLLIQTVAAGNKGEVIRATASQTANLTEWQNSSSTVLAKVDALGNATFTSIDGGTA